jgi:putative tryptophan/tyrosine transport system substrate-binding protein
MNRRAFLSLAGGAAAAWPLAAQAQPGGRTRRIGVMLSGRETDQEMQSRVGALRNGLKALGWVEGRSYQFEYRWPGSDPEQIRAAATEMARAAPDIIVVGHTLTALALRKETTRIPIVFVNIADPVGSGVVASLARTGGNITGFTAFEFATAGKWLDVLTEIAPGIKRAALLFGTSEISANGERFYHALERVAPKLSVELTPVRVRGPADVHEGIAAFASRPDGGLLAAADPGGVLNRGAIIAAAAHHRLPAVYPFRFFVQEGGLASYGVDLNDEYRRAASYVDRILKGTAPADLPVQAPDKFELIINLKTAKSLGIEVPPTLLARADEVIE